MGISSEIEKRRQEAIKMIPDMVAERATEYFKERFKSKEFDGQPWKPWSNTYRHRTNGSLMVDTGALMNSIRPAEINEQKVTIAAGNTKVRYAKVHNEGFVGSVVVKQHTRTSKTGTVYSVKEHKSNRNIPQRQFIGPAKELTEILKEDIIQLIKSAIER